MFSELRYTILRFPTSPFHLLLKITAWLTLIKLSCAFFRECGFSSVTEPRLGACSTRLPTLQKQRKPEKKRKAMKKPQSVQLSQLPELESVSAVLLSIWQYS